MIPLPKDFVIPDEIWIEIFLRLPLLSLNLFKSVSKHWLSLMTSSYFIRRLLKPRIDSPCGLFIRRKYSEHYDFVTLGPSMSINLQIGSRFKIMHSCNGLLLCRSYDSDEFSFRVYNPITNLSRNIPPPPKSHENDIILAFDPTKSHYYKLVSIRSISRLTTSYQQIQIYSSETGEWRLRGPLYPRYSFQGFSKGLYWNNAIHWINYDDNVYSKFDIVEHQLVTNERTPALDNVDYRRLTKLFESRGSLLLLLKESSCRYHVFEMREDSSEWSVKYILDDLNNIVPLGRMQNCFICIVLGERGDDSFMVIESRYNMVRYNFVSKTTTTLCNFVPSYQPWSCFPFISSLARV